MKLTILGCTGSIGVNTLDVIRRHGDRYHVVALCAHRQHDLLFQQCLEFKPEYAVLGDYVAASNLQERLKNAGLKTQVLSGVEALERMASLPEVDAVMAAIVGSAGLRPTLAAAQAGKKILLANKEALVMAGPVFMQAVQDSGALLLPIDSEHNAIFQSLPSGFERNTSCSIEKKGIRRLLLTASGGPFLNRHGDDLENVTPAQAVAHPNWVMGQKISVDSATMMNKGLEVIEAHWLFGVAAEHIDVVIHPQSVIHSMVEYLDGSVIAQLGNPDMRTPIAHALAYPERIEAGVGSLDFFKIGRLEFQPPDMERFPCLALAYQALRAGGSASTTLNAANEIAVQAFLDGKLGFGDISRLIAAALDAFPAVAISSLAEVLAADSSARVFSLAYLAEHVAK